jgi:hypothetical protein
MHFERSRTHEEPRSPKLLLLTVLAQNVADILAKEALDALAKFLNAIHIALVHLPRDAGPWLKRGNLLIDFEIPGDISDQILNHRESLHGKDGDGLIKRERVHARFACEPRPAIDLG